MYNFSIYFLIKRTKYDKISYFKVILTTDLRLRYDTIESAFKIAFYAKLKNFSYRIRTIIRYDIIVYTIRW